MVDGGKSQMLKKIFLVILVAKLGFCAVLVYALRDKPAEILTEPGVNAKAAPQLRLPCTHHYVNDFDNAKSDSIKICSYRKLSQHEQEYIGTQYFNGVSLYLTYLIREHGRTDLKGGVPHKAGTTVYLLTYKDLNSSKIFSKHYAHSEVSGRYLNGSAKIFVSDRIFDKESNNYTDIPHEAAHYVNDIIGIKGERNESLAQKFEKYYRSALIKKYGHL
jgi:hypothetical protein